MKMQKSCDICKEKTENKYLKDKNVVKLEIIVVIQGNMRTKRCLKYNMPIAIYVLI